MASMTYREGLRVPGNERGSEIDISGVAQIRKEIPISHRTARGHFGSQRGTGEDKGSHSHSQGPNLKLERERSCLATAESSCLQHPCQKRDEMPSPFFFSPSLDFHFLLDFI